MPGGISPITRDFVNPERPWPHLAHLAATTAAAGKLLLPRLPVYPEYLGLMGADRSSRESDTPEQSPALAAAAAAPAPATAPAAGAGQASVAGVPDLGAACGSPAAALPRSLSQRAWLDFTGGRDSVGAAVLRSADSEGLLRASSWVAGRPDAGSANSEEEERRGSAAAPSVSCSERDRQPPEGLPPQQREASEARPEARASVPLPRWREGRSWRVAVGADGALEGVPSPTDPSPDVVRCGGSGRDRGLAGPS